MSKENSNKDIIKIKEEIINLLSENNVDDVSDYTVPEKDVPHVIMVVGVNWM